MSVSHLEPISHHGTTKTKLYYEAKIYLRAHCAERFLGINIYEIFLYSSDFREGSFMDDKEFRHEILPLIVAKFFINTKINKEMMALRAFFGSGILSRSVY